MSSSSTNTLGKYEIIREIGRSNDIVYEALDPSISRRVALKELWMAPTLQGAQRRERIERFRREGKAAGKLSHPNIVTIYEVGQDGDRYFIAMEYLEGRSLRDMLQSSGPMSVSVATDYLLQLCAGLSYAHACGVIHRDIKPENIQVLPGGHVKLTDFGIARLTDEPSITQDGQVFGTPSYMSPEQVAGKALDTRSDIFSVGVVLYEMIAGHKPFAGDSVVTITYNIMHMDPPPPPGAPPYIVGIIRRAMAKEPDMRYSTIDELAQDLRDQRSSGAFVPDLSQAAGYPSPFGGPHPGQPPSGPVTPYGTPAPSPGAGSAPDPFAQSAPVPIPMPAPTPTPPVMSAETRNFVGVMLLAVGFVGMLIFAVWAVNLAYNSYLSAQTTGAAQRYYEQGNKLFSEGDIDAAISQWRIAAERAPDSEIGRKAREAIFNGLVHKAYRHVQDRSYPLVEATARELISIRDDAPEGHFYLGYALEMRGDRDGAVSEYELAERHGGNDEYAQRARERLSVLSPGTGGTLPGLSAPTQPQPPADEKIPFMPATPGH